MGLARQSAAPFDREQRDRRLFQNLPPGVPNRARNGGATPSLFGREVSRFVVLF